MIKKKEAHPELYFVILTSLAAKPYLGNMCLSSSSSTMLIDSDDVPALTAFKQLMSCVHVGDYNEPITEDMPIVQTLSELLEQSRDPKKKGVVFRNQIEITGVRTKNSWFVFTCSGGKCRKGVTRKGGIYKCKGCDTKVDYPRTRFRLQLDVHDGSMTTVVVCFDETAEKLVNRTAKSLLDDQQRDDSPDATVLPPVVEALIGTKHIFEIKSHTYYHFGEYESYNCANVILPSDTSSNVSPLIVDDKFTGYKLNESSSSTPKRAGSVTVPVKAPDPKRRKFCIDDSETEDGDIEIGKKAYGSGKAITKRLSKISDQAIDDVEGDEDSCDDTESG